MENIKQTEQINICKRCHRRLKDNQSTTLGFGPICYKKYLEKQKVYLFDIKEELCQKKKRKQ